MPTCLNGHRVDAGVNFCHECGAPVGPEDTTIPVARPVQAHNSNTTIYIFSGVLIAFAVVAVAVVLIMNSGGSPSSRPQTGPTVVATDSTSQTDGPGDGTAPSPSGSLPDGGTLCPAITGATAYGTIGRETSCGFADSVRTAYLQAGGTGQALTVTAISPATHKSYDNIACDGEGTWVVCVGGSNNSARLFFALQ